MTSDPTPTTSPAAPHGVDITKPAAARVYDWYLGGAHNFDVDREFGREMVERLPVVARCAVENRDFLRRAVEWLCEQGVDQFLDLGSGVPTAGNVHEIAQRHNAGARTVYVDYEQVAVTHANMVLDEQDPARERTTVVQADLRNPAAVLEDPETTRLLDLDRPVALLVVAVLHFVAPADRPEDFLQQYRDALAPGSFVALSQMTNDGAPQDLHEQAETLRQGYSKSSNPGYFRSRPEFTALFGDFAVVEPGVTWTPEWHPDSELTEDPARALFLCGVARHTG